MGEGEAKRAHLAGERHCCGSHRARDARWRSSSSSIDLGFPPKSCTWHLDGRDRRASEFPSSLQWMAGSTWRLMASLISSSSHAARPANCSARVTLPPRVSPSHQQAPPSHNLSSSASRATGSGRNLVADGEPCRRLGFQGE
jgi:hypothetical protein